MLLYVIFLSKSTMFQTKYIAENYLGFQTKCLWQAHLKKKCDIVQNLIF